MNRSAILLTVLLAVALVALSFFFLIKPKMDEVGELEVEAEDLRTQQTQVETQIASLEAVRADSPNLEAELAAVDGVIPDSPALPAALRQLQVAGDDSGVTLVSVAPGRPSAVEGATTPELSVIPLTLTLDGGYFQVVDFLRRIEDPAITARGILITSVAVNPSEYPTLSVNINASMFSLLEQAPAPAPEPDPTDTPTDGETDVDVDIDVTEEDAA